MTDRVLFVLTFAAALGSGLIGGVFFGFSSFIMAALARLPSAQGIAAMQSINVVVINRVFLTAFVGTAGVCAVLTASALFLRHRPGAAYVLAGSLLYIVGTFIVTMALNVPRNDALAVVDPASAEGARLWADYVVNWTRWNHVRTAAAVAAAASLTVALWISGAASYSSVFATRMVR
jgi:uncharacterized membrane protein